MGACCGPSMFPRASCVLVIPVSLTLLLATAFLILQMKKLRHRVARGLVQCHMANDWGCQDLNPDSPPQGFPHGSVVKNLPANAGDAGSIPGSGRSPGKGNSNPFWYSCLGNPMGRGAWRATVHGITKSHIRLSN